MARDLSNLFSLLVPNNDQNTASAIAKVIAFDDVGDFVAERERIRRKVELSLETEPKVDYSDFSQHVFFDSAVSKFEIAKNKMLANYPFAGDQEDKDLFIISSSYYENYVTSIWPRFAGYVNFTGSNQYIGVRDNQSTLCLNSSSLYISARLQPSNFAQRQSIVEVMSGSKAGYSFGVLSGALLNLTIYSGSSAVSVSAALPTPALLTQSFHTYAAIYDQPSQFISLYSDSTRFASGSVSLGSVNFSTAQVLVGNSQFATAAFNGLIGDVRVMHTASERFHGRFNSRAIASEDYVKLYYKLNEGITRLSSSDAIAIDYSKSGLHGLIYNYGPNTRFSGSCLYQDDGDPVLYGFHPDVIAFSASIEASASAYDSQNRNYILRLIPETLLEDDQDSQGLLISFSLAMARYFDELKTSVDQFDNLRVTNYEDSNETPDIMLPMLKKYFGWKVTDHFGDANPLEYFFGDNILSTGSLGESLHEVRNQFWRRILNSLPYLYKTKGKRNNLDSFFNVLGINNDLLNLKEYGYLNNNTIADDRISKNKPIAFLGFGSGSAQQRVVMPNFLSGANNQEWTIETVAQLPYAGMPFAASGLIGTIWQMYDATGLGYSLQWKINVPGANAGYLRFKDDSYGAYMLTPPLTIFNGQFVHIATTLANATASLQVRQINNGTVTTTTCFNSASGPLTSGSYSFLVGAGSGSYAVSNASGFYGEVRYWSRALSGSELDAHALDFQNVGLRDAKFQQSILKGHWTLDEYRTADGTGTIIAPDHSQRGNDGRGSNFVPYANPYQKTLTNYQFLSPSLDLKWSNNKIRVRNKTELSIADIGSDTNQVTLEFNLVDALNEDISKIFSTLDMMNQAIGSPVNKYRDEYQDLESLRRVYFSRLGDSINFTQFFKLFRWFDRKLASSIKQLLPARVDFIGGEFTVDSHLLERNKYQYKFPVFHTPKDISDGEIKEIVKLSGSVQRTIQHDTPLRGTYVHTQHDTQRKLTPKFRPREASVIVDAQLGPRFISRQIEGHERVWRNKDSFFPRKSFGDKVDERNASHDSSNYRNEYTRAKLKTNEVYYQVSSDEESDHGFRRYLRLESRFLSASSLSSSFFLLSGTTSQSSSIELLQSIWDSNNLALDTASFSATNFGEYPATASLRYDTVLTFRVSSSQTVFSSSDISVSYQDQSSYWNSYRSIIPFGAFFAENDGWYRFQVNVNAAQFAFDSGSSRVSLTVPKNTCYAFKDVRMSFSEPLSSLGVINYRNFDNQNNKKWLSVKNRKVLADALAARYDTAGNALGYNNWVDYPGYMSGSSGILHAAADSTGSIYVASYGGGTQPGNSSPGNVTDYRIFKCTGVSCSLVDSIPSLLTYTGGTTNTTAYGLKVCIDKDDNVFVLGASRGLRYSSEPTTVSPGQRAFVRCSTDKGNTWQLAFLSGTATFNTNTIPAGMDIDSSGAIYVLLNWSQGTSAPWRVYKSPNVAAASTSTSSFILSDLYSVSSGSSVNVGMDLKVDKTNDYVYVTGYSGRSGGTYDAAYVIADFTGALRISPDRGTSWITATASLNKAFGKMAFNSASSELYVVAGNYYPVGTGDPFNNNGTVSGSYSVLYGDLSGAVSASLRNMSPTFNEFPAPYLTYGPPMAEAWTRNATCIHYEPNDGIYVSQTAKPNNASDPTVIWNANVKNSGSWFLVNQYSNANPNQDYYTRPINFFVGKLSYSRQNPWYSNVAVLGQLDTNRPIFRLGNKRTYNVSTIGPFSLAPSFAYRTEQVVNQNNVLLTSGSYFYALGNVAEFPHYGGIYQMRNIVLGTQTKGRIGKTDESLIQIKHIGSVVEVMWPDQSLLEAPVQGFGELSIGQSPGKLQTSFAFGTLVDVSAYDHMSLYCYLQKQTSGTLDDIVVRIERRPLSSVGFAVDQSVEYDYSGSFTEARYKDVLHTKQVDYGDMGLREISYVIDQPLVNVREIRVGARLKNGQIDANQNFLIWGRFIKSANET